MKKTETISQAETKLPNAETYENNFISVPISKNGTFKIHNSDLPIEGTIYIVNFRKTLNHLNKTVWEFVSLDD